MLNAPRIEFAQAEIAKFDVDQLQHVKNIEKSYIRLLKHCITEVKLPPSGTHKDWIASRVKMHVNNSLMRLLYLAEAFCNTTKENNSVACAVLCKGMAEIPLHLGYLTWVISENHDFETIRKYLKDVAFGRRDDITGLTGKANVSGKDLYLKADLAIQKIFKDQPSSLAMLEFLYKETCATGHHNYEARMLCGLQKSETWNALDRTEAFDFFSKNLFQFFLYCDASLGMSSILVNAISHYLKILPDYLDKPSNSS